MPSRIFRQALTSRPGVEVLDHPANPLGGDVEAVALGDLLVAVVFADQVLGHRLKAVAGYLDA